MRYCPICHQSYEDSMAKFCPSDGQPLVQSNAAEQHSPPTVNVAKENPAPFSASLAVMFFANFFMKPVSSTFLGGGRLTSVITQPDVKVYGTHLGNELVAVSLWFLQHNNLIRLTIGGRAKNSFRSSVVVEVNRASQQRIPGLEFDLLEIARHSPPSVTVHALATALLGKRTFFPVERIYDRMTQWAVQFGYGQHAVIKKPFFSSGATEEFKFAPDHNRIAHIQPLAQSIQQSWMQYKSQQSELVKSTYAEIDSAQGQLTFSDD